MVRVAHEATQLMVDDVPLHEREKIGEQIFSILSAQFVKRDSGELTVNRLPRSVPHALRPKRGKRRRRG
jgi:hypothetical protein